MECFHFIWALQLVGELGCCSMKALLCLALALVVVAASAYQASDFTGICTTGKQQSPINIEREKTHCVRAGTFEGVKHKIDFFYLPRHSLEVSNNGHTLKVLFLAPRGAHRSTE